MQILSAHASFTAGAEGSALLSPTSLPPIFRACALCRRGPEKPVFPLQRSGYPAPGSSAHCCLAAKKEKDHDRTKTIPLNRLVPDAENGRRIGRAASTGELTASIRARFAAKPYVRE